MKPYEAAPPPSATKVTGSYEAAPPSPATKVTGSYEAAPPPPATKVLSLLLWTVRPCYTFTQSMFFLLEGLSVYYAHLWSTSGISIC